MLNGMKDSARQLRYPKEFRIGHPKWPDFEESMEGIAGLLNSSSSEVEMRSGNDEDLLELAIEVGTLVWRIQQRLTNMDDLPQELRRVSRDLESTWDTLAQRGIEIKDHTDQNYDSGMALHVVTSQPVAGLTQQQIIETIKPTIYYRENIVQRGQVILGVPLETEASEPIKETIQKEEE